MRIMSNSIKRVCCVVAGATVLLAGSLSLSACSGQLTAFVTGKAPYRPSYWVIEADTSGSTAQQRRPGGAYEQEIMGALRVAARGQATVYASAVDGNAFGDAGWIINGVTLRSASVGGSAKLAEVARMRKARGLRPQARRLLETHPTGGSDIVGALQRVGQLAHDLPPRAPKTLVLLTDGAIDLQPYGGYDIYTDPPVTAAERQAVIASFKRAGELPNLTGWRVYLGGIALGVHDRRTARAVITLWEALIPATGAQLVQINSMLAWE